MAGTILDSRLLLEVVWQSTLWLSLGVVLSLLWRHRPARAHQVLLLAVVAAVLTPAMSAAARSLGWGLLAPAEQTVLQNAAPDAQGLTKMPPTVAASKPISEADHRPAVLMQPSPQGVPLTQEPTAASSVSAASAASAFFWPALLWAWAGVSLLLLARLAWASSGSVRVIAESQPAADPRLERAAGAAAARLGLDVQPQVRITPRALAPIVWCWFRQPVLMVPASAIANDRIDWHAVFCHELGHFKRRDHWSALAAELIVCLLPWHPLAWCARHRMMHLSEWACDDWAVDTGASRADFAESLLSFVPSRRPALVLCAVSTGGLRSRIQRVLSDSAVQPRAGALWGGVVCALALSMSALMAMAQTADSPRMQKPVPPAIAPAESGAEALSPLPTLQQNPIVTTGRVISPTGAPVAGAKVYVSKPYFEKWTEVGVSDEQGRVRIVIEGAANPRGDADKSGSIRFAALADGFGFGWIDVKPGELRQEDRLTFKLVEDVPIEGRVINAEGEGVPGVAVYVNRLSEPNGGTLDAYIRKAAKQEPGNVAAWSDNVWSRAVPGRSTVKTDADGRFRMTGIGAERLVELSLKGDNVHNWWINVATRRPPNADPAAFNAIRLVEPPYTNHYYATFTHVTAPHRKLRGVVRDKLTGRGLPNVLVKADFASSTEVVTDAVGRFEIPGAIKEPRYKIEALPRERGHFHRELYVRDTPGLEPLETTIELLQGIVVRGRVLDRQTGKPVQGTVEYYPLFPNLAVERFGGDVPLPSSTCPIDADGSYELQVLPGPGAIGVLNFEPQYTTPTINAERVEQVLDGFPVEINSSDYLATAAGGQGQGLIGPGRFKALELIKVEEGAKELPLDLFLIPGRDVHGKVLNLPENAVTEIEQAGMFSARSGFGPTKMGNGRFRVRAIGPGESRQLLLYDPQRQMGASAVVTAAQQGELSLTLEPCGTVTGRLVNAEGRAITNASIQFSPLTQRFIGGRTWGARTDDQGRFEVTGLIPGASYQAVDGVATDLNITLKPGEKRDLGDVPGPQASE